MKSLKSRYTDKRNMCVIDFYRFVDTIDINQIRFTDFSVDLSIDYSGNIRICMGKNTVIGFLSIKLIKRSLIGPWTTQERVNTH